ncbi:hypothetical protein Shyhy02_40820 [Streptomyces hygroscopicus subsp. hygroscopicus]|nr:hypothetical protein Shyhy02_40820 [Streptomyces hygroscopicus subsp. hygroscopicus]
MRAFRGRWEMLSAGRKAAGRSQVKIRTLVGQAVATLKSWRFLRKLRYSATPVSPASSKPSSLCI